MQFVRHVNIVNNNTNVFLRRSRKGSGVDIRTSCWESSRARERIVSDVEDLLGVS